MIKKVSRYLLGSKGRRDLAAAQENKLRDRGKQTPEHLDAFSDPNMELEEFCDRTLASMTQGALEEYEEQLTAQVAAADGMLEAEVLQHHSSFIGMCRGVAEMESKCQVLRNITATLSSQLDSLSQLEAVQAPLLVCRSAHSLSGDASDSLEAGTGRPRQQPQQPILQQQQPEARRMLSGSEASWAAVLDRLDEAMADGDMPNTTMLLQKAQAVLESVQETVEGAGRSEGAERDAAEQEEAVAVSKLLSQRLLDLEDVRARLVPMLQAAIAAATHDSEQVQDSLQLLGNVAGPVAAARALLDRRAAELEALQVSTRNAWTTALSSGDTDMIDHVSLLSQQAFGSVADAVRDVQAAFGGSTELAAVCTMWALHQARLHALLLTTDVLSAHSNAAGLTPVVLSICASLVYCKALEQSLGLCLTPTLLQSSLPLVVRVIRSKGGMMVEEAQRSVQADIQHLAASSAPLAEGKLLPSASRLVHETSRLASQLLPLAGPQLGRPMQSLMSRLVTGYFEGISRAANQHRLSSGAFRGALDKSLEVLMDMAYDFILALINAMEPLAAAVGRLVDASAAEEHLNALGAALGLQSSEPGAAAA